MNPRAVLFIAVLGLLFAAFAIELVRRRLVRPEYVLVWGVMAFGTGVLAFLAGCAPWLMTLSGLSYQSLVTLLGFLFTSGMVLTLTVIANRQGKRVIRLTQENALLRMEIERLRSTPAAQSSPAEDKGGDA